MTDRQTERRNHALAFASLVLVLAIPLPAAAADVLLNGTIASA